MFQLEYAHYLRVVCHFHANRTRRRFDASASIFSHRRQTTVALTSVRIEHFRIDDPFAPAKIIEIHNEILSTTFANWCHMLMLDEAGLLPESCPDRILAVCYVFSMRLFI